MKLKTLSLSLAFTVASPVFAAMSDAQLAQALRQDISKHFVTLKAPKLVFHWVDASDINPSGQYNSAFPANASHYKSYTDKQGSKIYRARNSRDSDVEGPGLYMATDPLVSRAYGGKNTYGLIVGIMKPGARILANAYTTLPIAANLQAELSGRGCTGVTMYPEILDTYGNTPCLKVKQLLVGSDVSFADGRFYSFGTGDIEGCRSRFGAKDLTIPASKVKTYEGLDTFVVYSSRMMSEVLGFTHKTAPGSHALANQIMSYLKGLQVHQLNTYSGYSLVSQEQLNNPAIKAMSKADIAKFSQAHIMGCNK
jgi:hypothetical protein